MFIFSLSVFIGKFVDLVATENGAVFANILCADVASAAFSYSALHAKFHCRVYLSFIKSEFLQARKSEFNHYRRSAENGYLVCREIEFLNIIRNKSDVTVPFGLLTVYCQMNVDTRIV